MPTRLKTLAQAMIDDAHYADELICGWVALASVHGEDHPLNRQLLDCAHDLRRVLDAERAG